MLSGQNIGFYVNLIQYPWPLESLPIWVQNITLSMASLWRRGQLYYSRLCQNIWRISWDSVPGYNAVYCGEIIHLTRRWLQMRLLEAMQAWDSLLWAATGNLIAVSCKFHMGHLNHQRLENSADWMEKPKPNAEPIMAHTPRPLSFDSHVVWLK